MNTAGSCLTNASIYVRVSGPVHGGKRKNPEVVRSYEKIPRKLVRTEEREVIHLLPIKDQTGLVPRSVERGTAASFHFLTIPNPPTKPVTQVSMTRTSSDPPDQPGGQ